MALADRRRLLELAVKGLEADMAEIDNEISQLRNELSGSASDQTKANGMAGRTSRKRRAMSAEARRRISEGMKRRYAQMKSTSKQSVQATSAQGRGLTTAGRKKLSEMMKARWAAKKRAGRNAA